ncbi:uncharacterized protein LOC121728971 [Aricia agestis]|uniref:uncharacterized protein LOC121728971 n=1 Tax=Aricia agestis TaxID=91739 RepID=UPI001C204E19|nr:uncharacterized protein LOC121728971 [Aricia agestis]
MFRIVLGVVAVALTVAALPSRKPEPGDLALMLNEEEFEDYLDSWLAVEEQSWVNASAAVQPRSGCSIRVNGDLGQPQPIFIRRSTNTYPAGTGNSGVIHLNTGEEVIVSCPGSGRTILHPQQSASVQTGNVQCVSDAQVTGLGWLNGVGEFGHLTCTSHSFYEAIATNERCYNNHVMLSVGFVVNNVFHPLYHSCFDQTRLEVLYVRYEQNPWNAVHQTGVTRPSWIAGGFFPGVAINTVYTQVQQKQAIAQLVGSALADVYVTSTQFLARGHLAAKTDFVYASGQRASHVFINAAPQWQPFNAGNWNWLEQNLRQRIGEAGYNTVIYTGTFGVSQLRNANGHFVDIYLNGGTVPVPLYYYKVVYDASRSIGTAFISINNPYYTLEEARAMQFCTDRCRNNAAFNWLRWQPDRLDIGYSFCCTVDDFRRRIPHLPEFTVNALLS